MSPTIAVGSMSMRSFLRISSALRFISFCESTMPRFFSRPRNMFSATVRCWHMFNSW